MWHFLAGSRLIPCPSTFYLHELQFRVPLAALSHIYVTSGVMKSRFGLLLLGRRLKSYWISSPSYLAIIALPKPTDQLCCQGYVWLPGLFMWALVRRWIPGRYPSVVRPDMQDAFSGLTMIIKVGIYLGTWTAILFFCSNVAKADTRNCHCNRRLRDLTEQIFK